MQLYFLILLCILFFFLVWNNDKEKFTNTEAIQNIASLYNKEKLVVTDLEVTNDLTVGGVSGSIPKGGIIAWTGIQAPKGWVLCNGSNGTPDLRGRFIYGYGGSGISSKINSKGGSEKHTLSVDEMPKHKHKLKVSATPTSGGDKRGHGIDPAGDSTIKYTHEIGGGKAHNNMPPYFVLAYIMKL